MTSRLHISGWSIKIMNNYKTMNNARILVDTGIRLISSLK
ncbi:Uncharacterised protein [Scardovia inopinata]|uniref:Uncharacterized protein n=1 Tax=Scardovia inopinata F0304 TaxID=641146 RepID=W1MXH0_SCAIO|nr:hypothetical protein HMPREF9020_01486 [Scardovia inopinata F0304]SUV51764.1 Uncharacterised protein [Scardovia inopinata]